MLDQVGHWYVAYWSMRKLCFSMLGIQIYSWILFWPVLGMFSCWIAEYAELCLFSKITRLMGLETSHAVVYYFQ